MRHPAIAAGRQDLYCNVIDQFMYRCDMKGQEGGLPNARAIMKLA